MIKKQKPLPPIEKEEEPFEIPSSWEWVRLGDIGVIKSGGTPKTNVEEYWDYGTIPWITPADMGKVTHKKYLSNCNKKITNIGLEKSSAQLIPENSIVYSIRAPIGHINIVPFSYTTNQGCKSYTAIKGNIDYFYYILLGSKSRIEKEGSGTTFKEISLTAFSNVLVPLSPLKEQQRIVSKIEELFAELDKIDKAQETYDSAANKLSHTYLNNKIQKYNNLILSDVIKNIRIPKDKKLDSDSIKIDGKFPVVTQSKTFISGYQNNENKVIYHNEPYILFGDHTKEVKYIDFDFSVSGDGVKLLNCKDKDIDIEYLYFVIKDIAYNLGDRGYRRYYSLLKNKKFIVPPLEVQKHIVETLKNIEDLL